MNGLNATARKVLLGCGVASSALYVATDIIGSLRYPGYRYLDQEFSELLAAGSPVRPFMLAANVGPYTLLLAAFLAGIWAAAGPKQRAARLTVALLAGYHAFGVVGGGLTPMVSRGMASTPRNDLHGPLTLVSSILFLAAVGVAATLLGKPFRHYSYGTIVTMLAFGIVTSLQIPQLAANEPTPWMGLTERVDIYAMMLWVVALAVGLWRAQESAALSEPAKLKATQQRAQAVPR